MSQDQSDVQTPVYFECRGHIYRGFARYYAGWSHLDVTGRLLKTGGWDSAYAIKELGDDKFSINKAQLDELVGGSSVQIEFDEGIPTSITAGDYSPPSDDRRQSGLFT